MMSKLGFFLLVSAMSLSKMAMAQSDSIYNDLRCHQFVKMFSSELGLNSYGRYRLADGQKFLDQTDILDHASPLINTGTGGYKHFFSDGTSNIVWSSDGSRGEFTNNIFMLLDQTQSDPNKIKANFYTTQGNSYILELTSDEGQYQKDNDFHERFVRTYSVKLNIGKDEAGNQLPPLLLYIVDNLKDSKNSRYIRVTPHGLEDDTREDLKLFNASFKPTKNFRKTSDASVASALEASVSSEVTTIGNFVTSYNFDEKGLQSFKKDIAEDMMVAPYIPEPSRDSLGQAPTKWLGMCRAVSGITSNPKAKAALENIERVFSSK